MGFLHTLRRRDICPTFKGYRFAAGAAAVVGELPSLQTLLEATNGQQPRSDRDQDEEDNDLQRLLEDAPLDRT